MVGLLGYLRIIIDDGVMTTVCTCMLMAPSHRQKSKVSKVGEKRKSALNLGFLVGLAAAGGDGMYEGRLTLDGQVKDNQSCPSTLF